MTVGAANVGKNIVMILDNFPSHKAKIARQYAEDFTIRPNVPYIKVSSRANSSIGGTDGTCR